MGERGNNVKNEILFDVTQATSRTGGPQSTGTGKRGEGEGGNNVKNDRLTRSSA